MNKPNQKTNTHWISLALEPAGKDEPSLAPALLISLMEDGLISTDDLLAQSPTGVRVNTLDYSWFEREDPWSIRRKERVDVPVWVHWLFSRDREKNEAAKTLNRFLDPQVWVKPLWSEKGLKMKNVNGLEILAEDAPEVLDSVLGRLDEKTVEELRNREPVASRELQLHGQNKLETIKVLLKHGWDINQLNKEGKSPIETIKREEAFLLLLENGADLDRARSGVYNVADTARDRQKLLKLIDEKKIAEQSSPPRPWQNLHDSLVAIIETGVSGGFATKIKKLHEEYPRAPEGGIKIQGENLGAGMLRAAYKMEHGSRVTGKMRSYFSLVEEILKYDGQGWVNLDAQIKGDGIPDNMSNRDGILMGAFIMLTTEVKNRRYSSSPAVFPRSRGKLESELTQWIPENLSRVSTAISSMTREETEYGPLYHWEAEDTLTATLSWDMKKRHHSPVGGAVEKWIKSLDGLDPLLIAIRDSEKYNSPGSVEVTSDRRSLPVIEVKSAREASQAWPENFCSILEGLEGLDDDWYKKIGSQFRMMATQVVLSCFRAGFISNMQDHFQHLLWAAEPEMMKRDQQAWQDWVDDLEGVKIPLVKISEDLLHPHEIIIQHKHDLIIEQWSEKELEERKYDLPGEMTEEGVLFLDLLSDNRQDRRDEERNQSLSLIKKSILIVRTMNSNHDRRGGCPKIKM